MRKWRLFALTLALVISWVAYLYLHFQPGLLTRPEVGSSYIEMVKWLEKHDYELLDDKTAGKNLNEASLETARDPRWLRIYEARKRRGTLFSIGRLHRQQSLCGSGQYFVFWRFDAQEKFVAEIYYDDQFCYI